MRAPRFLILSLVVGFFAVDASDAAPPTRIDPRRHAYALIDEELAEAALAAGDVVQLERALAAGQARLELLPPPDAATAGDDLAVHLAWQLFWYRLRALGQDDATNLYARELDFQAAFPSPERLAAVRASFRRLFAARQLVAGHPRIAPVARAQRPDFEQAIEAYAPRFARASADPQHHVLVATTSIFADPWAAAQWQQCRIQLRREPAAVLATIARHDPAQDRDELQRAQLAPERADAQYWLNRVKLRMLALQDAIELLGQDERLCRLVRWYEVRGPLYRDARAGGWVAEMELYAAVAPALGRIHSGVLRDVCATASLVTTVEARVAALPPSAPTELFAQDFPAGAMR